MAGVDCRICRCGFGNRLAVSRTGYGVLYRVLGGWLGIWLGVVGLGLYRLRALFLGALDKGGTRRLSENRMLERVTPNGFQKNFKLS